MDWILETLGGSDYYIEPDDWDLSRYYDEGSVRASEASLSVSRRVPVVDKQWIRAVENGKTLFLGYINRKPTIESLTKKTVSASGVEALLFNCPCPVMAVSYGTVTMAQMWADDAYPGLIYAANSHIPPGWLEDTLPAETTGDYISHGPGVVTDAANGIVKFANLGTKSRIGTKTIYLNGTAYSDKSTYAAAIAADRSTYRDVNDLYVHFYYNSALERSYKFSPMFALNAYDTRCRTGTIDNSTYTFNTPIQVGPEQTCGEIQTGIATVHGMNVRPRYVDQLCYIDALDDFEAEDGIYDIYDWQCAKIDIKERNSAMPSSLTGLGACPRLFQQCQSVVDVTPGGAFVRATEDYPETYFDADGNLCEYLTAQWSASRVPNIVTLDTDAHNFIPMGSSARLHIAGEADVVYQLHSLKMSSRGYPVLELGARSKDILDAISALNATKNSYAFGESLEVEELINESGDISLGAANNSRFTSFTTNPFTVPSFASVSDLNPRVLVDITISNDATGYVRAYDSTGRLVVSVANSTSMDETDAVREAETVHYIPTKDELSGIDITRKITWGGTNYIRVQIELLGNLDDPVNDILFNISVRAYIVSRRSVS